MIIDLLSDKNGYLRSKSISERADELHKQLQYTERRFNEITDSYEIEACIYRLKELEMRYSSLIREAKLDRLCADISVRRDRT